MVRSLISGASLLLCACSLAQLPGSPTQFIASRQPEVERMAEIFYNTRLDRGVWTPNNLPGCETLPHHAFVRLDGASTSFLAIYDLTHPPARSLDQPWQGGITFVRVRPPQQALTDSGPSPDYLVVALNRALRQERAAHPPSVPDPQAVARCFISISGNTPLADPETASQTDRQMTQPSETAAPVGPPITGAIVPLTPGPNVSRHQYVNFTKDGLITDAGVSVTPK